MITERNDYPHRRRNALTGEWIIVSPHRNQRPWTGREESTSREVLLAHDPNCYLCPGNPRANGECNPDYQSTFVFPNDYPAILPNPALIEIADDPVLRSQALQGECRVICFSPRHDLTLARMPVPQIRTIVDTWAQQTAELSRRWQWVQVFENKGELMGCSNPHPHCQVWATNSLPNEAMKELTHQNAWMEQYRKPLLLHYAVLEHATGHRIVERTDNWLAVVPWWAAWPFETLILPRRHVLRLPDLESEERDDLAALLKNLLSRYDRLFNTSFPYSLGWHGAPAEGGESDQQYQGWQLHAHIYPPLLRSATVRKFMVGYELLAEPQRDLTPEAAAARLRCV